MDGNLSSVTLDTLKPIADSFLLRLWAGLMGSAILGVVGLGMGVVISFLTKNDDMPKAFAGFGAILGFVIGFLLGA